MENGAVESDALGVLCAAISAPGHKTLQSQPHTQQCSVSIQRPVTAQSREAFVGPRRYSQVLPGSGASTGCASVSARAIDASNESNVGVAGAQTAARRDGGAERGTMGAERTEREATHALGAPCV